MTKDQLNQVFVTGFDAFGDNAVNPSELLVHALENRLKDRAKFEVLPTSYFRCRDRLELIVSQKPKIMIMFGYSKNSKGLKLESLTRNAVNQKLIDNDGQSLRGEIIVGGPATIHTLVDLDKLKTAAGGTAYLSENAGGYVCNFAYYLALYNRVPAIFIHVPKKIDEQVMAGAEKIVRSFF